MSVHYSFLLLLWTLVNMRFCNAISQCSEMTSFTCPAGFERQDLKEDNSDFYELTLANDALFQNPVDGLYPKGGIVTIKKDYIYIIRTRKNDPKNVQVHCLSAEISKAEHLKVIMKQYKGQPRGTIVWKTKHTGLPGGEDFTKVFVQLPAGGVPKAEKIKLKNKDGGWKMKNLHMIACHETAAKK